MPNSTLDAAAAATGPLAYFIDLEPPQDNFLADTLAGLGASPKTMSPKYFYDKRGSEIFDDICRTPEYYVTRTEMALLKSMGADLKALAPAEASVVEYGSGSSWKIRALLDALKDPAEYVAIDISSDHLREAATLIARDYPAIQVGAICADFTQPIALPTDVAASAGGRLGFLPGSTIGNLTPEHATAFLTHARDLLGDDGSLLIGVDLVKNTERLEAAYNDAGRHTAAFNLNLLVRMQTELGADIDPDAFEHRAFFNPDRQRIEMHLAARRATAITVGGQTFAFAAGETIHTENSHKYTVDGFHRIARSADFTAREVWCDPDDLFSLHYLVASKD